jgi:16S rRNA (guanine527-N7)-methyltransferase
MLNNLENSIIIDQFIKNNNLNDKQSWQFQEFYNLLKEWNNIFNITNITGLKSVLNNHFQDSIYINRFIDLQNYKSIADIGSGGGFPGIPLKITNPDISIKLIEVNNKRIKFLNEVISKLDLKDIEVINLDWRTFLRKSEHNIDIFCARASLDMSELIRLFKPGCRYKNSMLVYWASNKWDKDIEYKGLIDSEFPYSILNKKRRLILLKNS